jgi:hypothetical protein
MRTGIAKCCAYLLHLYNQQSLLILLRRRAVERNDAGALRRAETGAGNRDRAARGPTVGEMAVMDSASTIVNGRLLLATPSTVIMSGPVVAFAGTIAVTKLSLVMKLFPVTPLNVTTTPGL